MPPKTSKSRKTPSSSSPSSCCICCQKIGPNGRCSLLFWKLSEASSSLLRERQRAILQSSDFGRPASFPLQKDEEVAQLLKVVNLLKDELHAIKESKQDATKQSEVWPPLATDAGQPTKKTGPTFDGEHSVSHSTRTQSSHNNASKFNMVWKNALLVGLASSPTCVVDVLSSVGTSIQPQSV